MGNKSETPGILCTASVEVLPWLAALEIRDIKQLSLWLPPWVANFGFHDDHFFATVMAMNIVLLSIFWLNIHGYLNPKNSCRAATLTNFLHTSLWSHHQVASSSLLLDDIMLDHGWAGQLNQWCLIMVDSSSSPVQSYLIKVGTSSMISTLI